MDEMREKAAFRLLETARTCGGRPMSSLEEWADALDLVLARARAFGPMLEALEAVGERRDGAGGVTCFGCLPVDTPKLPDGSYDYDASSSHEPTCKRLVVVAALAIARKAGA